MNSIYLDRCPFLKIDARTALLCKFRLLIDNFGKHFLVTHEASPRKNMNAFIGVRYR